MVILPLSHRPTAVADGTPVFAIASALRHSIIYCMDKMRSAMKVDSPETKDLRVILPLRLAERVGAYAEEHNTTITNVVIEALDTFLRNQFHNSH
jgi:hypothetical protein